jgi:hypothetical protein
MTQTAPTTCSLDAAAAAARLARFEAIGRRALLSREERRDVRVLRFAADRRTEADLTEILSAESRCCPFLDLSLREEGGELVLEVGVDGEARAVATVLAEAFGPRRRRETARNVPEERFLRSREMGGRYDAGP